MSVLRNIAGRMASEKDGIARLGLPQTVSDAPAARHQRAALCAIAAAGLIAFAVAPLLLSAILPVSQALPVGAGIAGVLTLLSGLVTVGLSRHAAKKDVVAEDVAVAPASLEYDLFAGLVTVHDARGFVTGVHGRDAGGFLSWMRDPTGRGFLEQIHVLDRIAFLSAFDAIRQGAASGTVQLRMERTSMTSEADQFVHLRCDLAAIRNDDGIRAIVMQSRDVSAEVELKADAASKAVLAETSNEAKNRFLAAVSHELRTPLNAILGFSDILAGEYFGKLQNDRQREYVALINQSGAHLLSVVNTMLDMSKIEAGRYELIAEPFMVREAVSACEGMLALQAETKGVKLVSRLMRGLGEVNADRRAFQQILINLVGNAVKFTDRGGVVTIDAQAAGKDLCVVVSDTGIGIPAGKLALIGQPFMQVQNDYTRKYEGTGLGLSLVKGLVALHGGELRIASREGEGTVITMTIPLDGSGIAGEGERDGADETLAEFPPRLKASRPEEVFGLVEGGQGHGAAHAKTA